MSGSVRSVTLHRVALPLRRPFATAWGTMHDRELIVVEIGDGEGWGECSALPFAGYSGETIATGWNDLRTGAPTGPMAQAALEGALLDAKLRAEGVSFRDHLGGGRSHVEVGATVGFHDDPDGAAQEARGYADAGYRRVKLKVEPGRDVAVVSAVRAALPDAVELWVDANGSYGVDDVDSLQAMVSQGVVLVEQALPADDLDGHRALTERLAALVGLDESVVTVDDARRAVEARACSAVNVKPARLGGVDAAKGVHDLCVAAGVPVWTGGMLEGAIGRATALAIASLPGCSLSADLSASDRYFEVDIGDTFALDDDGCLRVPDGPGIGIEIDGEALARFTVDRVTIRREPTRAATTGA